MGKKNRIIVVDDEHDIIDILRENLETEDLDVLTAQSAKEALQLLKMVPVDVVISDIKMPGMSGLELAHEITLMQNRSPYLIYATATPLNAQEMYAGGSDGFVRKPIDFDLLESMITHFLKRADTEKEFRNKPVKAETLNMIEAEATKVAAISDAKESADKILECVKKIRNKQG